jgi:hypothetical protein
MENTFNLVMFFNILTRKRDWRQTIANKLSFPVGFGLYALKCQLTISHDEQFWSLTEKYSKTIFTLHRGKVSYIIVGLFQGFGYMVVSPQVVIGLLTM